MGSRYHLYQRKYMDKEGKESALWWYWYWESGKRIRKPAGENSAAPRLKREAQSFIDHLMEADAAGLIPKPAPMEALVHQLPSHEVPRIFREFASMLYQPEAQHLRRKAALADGKQIAEVTRLGHRSRLDNYLTPRWGNYTWAAFEKEGFADDFIDWLVDLERVPIHTEGTPTPASAPISNSTRNAIIETMGIALREARRSRLIRIVPTFERFKRGSKHQDTLTDGELARLFPEDNESLEKIWKLNDGRDHDTGILFGAMCCLGVSAGLRSGELRAVTADQILRYKLPSGEILYGLIVDKALNSDQEVVGLKKATEDDLRVRVVVLTAKTMWILDMYLKTIPSHEGQLFLFRGQPINKKTLGRRWAAGLKQAQIDTTDRRLTPHAMRYTFSTRMKMLVNEQTLQEVIGHKSEEMTRLYDRPHLEERLRQLADQRGAFDKFWKNTRND